MEQMTLSEKFQILCGKLDPNNNKSVYQLLDDLYIMLANKPDDELLQYSIKRFENQLSVCKSYLS